MQILGQTQPPPDNDLGSPAPHCWLCSKAGPFPRLAALVARAPQDHGAPYPIQAPQDLQLLVPSWRWALGLLSHGVGVL